MESSIYTKNRRRKRRVGVVPCSSTYGCDHSSEKGETSTKGFESHTSDTEGYRQNQQQLPRQIPSSSPKRTRRRPLPFFFNCVTFSLFFLVGNLWTSIQSMVLSSRDDTAIFGDLPNGGGRGEEKPAEDTENPVDIPNFDSLSQSAKDFMARPVNWTDPDTTFLSHNSSVSVIVVVMSARENFDRRDVIRKTWKQGHPNVFFVISAPCWVQRQYREEPLLCEGPLGHDNDFEQEMIQEQLQLEEEANRYGDMIYAPERPESYRALVHKLKFAYHWVVTHFSAPTSSIKWVAKANDDMFVRVESLDFLLSEDYAEHTQRNEPVVTGCIERNAQVHREGKWKELPIYKDINYPPWAKGSCGHVVSRPVFEYVASNRDTLIDYQGEDTSLGIWLSQDKDMQESTVFVDDSVHFRNDKLCSGMAGVQTIIVGHDFSKPEIRKCYTQRDENVNGDRKMVKIMQEEVRQALASGTGDDWDWMRVDPRRFHPKVDESNSTSLAVMIMSKRSHFLLRQTIRNTWAAAATNIFFFIPSPSTKTGSDNSKEDREFQSKLLSHEQSRYRDMFELTIEEGAQQAQSISLKEAYRLLINSSPSSVSASNDFGWFATVTDQMYVRLDVLARKLATLDETKPMVVGEIMRNITVPKDGDWAELVYEETTYPPWPKGSCGFVVSQPVAQFIDQSFDHLKAYTGSGPSLGIWLEQDVKIDANFENQQEWFKNDNSCMEGQAAVTGFNLPADRLRGCFEFDQSLRKGDSFSQSFSSLEVELQSMLSEADKMENEEGDELDVDTTSSSSVVVIVNSKRDNFLARHVIRKSWASNDIFVLFLIGSEPQNMNSESSTKKRLAYEMSRYKDMIVTERPEDMPSSPAFNLKIAYRFVIQSVGPHVQWLVAVTDSFYVRGDGLREFLTGKPLNGAAVYGQIMTGTDVPKDGPWADREYKKSKYPPWPKGSNGFAVSRSVAELVHHSFDSLYTFNGIGPSLGIWMDENEQVVGFQNAERTFSSSQECEDQDSLVIGFEFSPEQLWRCYEDDRLMIIEPMIDDETPNEVAQETDLEMSDDETEMTVSANNHVGSTFDKTLFWFRSTWSRAKVDPDATKLLVVGVLSDRGRFEQRHAIRSTWKRKHLNVFFMVPRSCLVISSSKRRQTSSHCHEAKTQSRSVPEEASLRSEQIRLEEEQARNEDIVLVDQPESTDGNERELFSLYRFVIKETKAHWVLKTTDESFVRVRTLETCLEQKFGHGTENGSNFTILGDEDVGETYHDFNKDTHTFVVSRNLAEFWISNEGASVELQQLHEEHLLGSTELIHDEQHFVGSATCENKEEVVVYGSGLADRQMEECYSMADEASDAPVGVRGQAASRSRTSWS